MEVKEHIEIKPFTTFRLGGRVAYFAKLASAEDVAEYAGFAEERGIPLLLLGGGSNIIFPDEGELKACVGKIAISGFEIIKEDSTHALLKIGAGEEWDSVVKRAVELNLSGIEALSAIPGTAGATPVQNVGAYGQEIADILTSVEVYDLLEKKIKILAKNECEFAYRDSIFKHEGKNRYVILSIALALSKNPPRMPAYAGVEAYFKEKNIQKPSLQEIREAIIEIRRHKLPDPKNIASCGSFFKNPIVGLEEAERVKASYPGAIIHETEDGTYKIGAGWMLDALGLKGKAFGNLYLYPQNALVLVNGGEATRLEVDETVSRLKNEVKKAFGVDIEPEPVFIS